MLFMKIINLFHCNYTGHWLKSRTIYFKYHQEIMTLMINIIYAIKHETFILLIVVSNN